MVNRNGKGNYYNGVIWGLGLLCAKSFPENLACRSPDGCRREGLGCLVARGMRLEELRRPIVGTLPQTNMETHIATF